MRLSSAPSSAPAPGELPLWPPILATRATGSRSALHAHHAMHLVACFGGELRVQTRLAGQWSKAVGVLTGPDVLHAIDARGVDVLLIFFDPESNAGEGLRGVLEGRVRLLSSAERDRLVRDARPDALMGPEGVEWARQLVAILGGTAVTRPRFVHPRVRKLLRLLRTMPIGEDRSLTALASAVGLSPSRLMHAFTESIGVPLRPYLAWLKLQRAAAAITTAWRGGTRGGICRRRSYE